MEYGYLFSSLLFLLHQIHLGFFLSIHFLFEEMYLQKKIKSQINKQSQGEKNIF